MATSGEGVKLSSRLAACPPELCIRMVGIIVGRGFRLEKKLVAIGEGG